MNTFHWFGNDDITIQRLSTLVDLIFLLLAAFFLKQRSSFRTRKLKTFSAVRCKPWCQQSSCQEDNCIVASSETWSWPWARKTVEAAATDAAQCRALIGFSYLASLPIRDNVTLSDINHREEVLCFSRALAWQGNTWSDHSAAFYFAFTARHITASAPFLAKYWDKKVLKRPSSKTR